METAAVKPWPLACCPAATGRDWPSQARAGAQRNSAGAGAAGRPCAPRASAGDAPALVRSRGKPAVGGPARNRRRHPRRESCRRPFPMAPASPAWNDRTGFVAPSSSCMAIQPPDARVLPEPGTGTAYSGSRAGFLRRRPRQRDPPPFRSKPAGYSGSGGRSAPSCPMEVPATARRPGSMAIKRRPPRRSCRDQIACLGIGLPFLAYAPGGSGARQRPRAVPLLEIALRRPPGHSPRTMSVPLLLAKLALAVLAGVLMVALL